jgi:superfamily II DNA or RNA helicase
MELTSGCIIKGPNWPEPVEISHVEEAGGYIRILGATTISRLPVDHIISQEELSEISLVEIGTDFSEKPLDVFLALETLRYRFASMYDPLLAVHTSKVDPLPHQIEAVYGYVLHLPRIRFLIADDPGAGKTIMAGLIIKELKLRHLVKRILIVTPGHLKDQWVIEMRGRFKEEFVPVDRRMLNAFYGENIWQRENQIITSIDFAKREDVLPSLTAASFDFIIVDEAHKMSAYRYGDKTEQTERYKLGKVLSEITEHLLFLTATPHKGDPDNFRLFLDLLEPGFFATNEMLQESLNNKDNPLFIRRIKEDLRDFEGKPLFLPRHVITKTFNLGEASPSEKELYNKLSRYVEEQYNRALVKNKRRNIAFALVILQRRLASSTYALWKSLERRKKRLEELLEGAQKPSSDATFDFEVVEDLSEEERWREEEVWEALSVAENREELKREIETLRELIEDAEKIIRREEEIKLRELKKSLVELSEKYPEREHKKILIFTESKDTLEYLEKKIRSWGYSVNTIHGGMPLEERVKAEAVFRNEADVMVATEAAGEGINLQFCHLMINYDIPWNPNRLEQRMGRIHRYGQSKEVYVFNLVAEDTREGKVLKRLFEKLEEIRQSLGEDKVFDVVSEVLYDKNLPQLLIEAAANARNIDEILKELEVTVDEDYIQRVRENLGESLATRYIDYTRIKEMELRAKEQRLIPEYTENYFKKAFARLGGKLRERQDGFLSVDSIPFELRRIAEREDFRKSCGALLKRYPKVTFNKDVGFKNPDVEFVSFGHPLFEAVMTWAEESLSESLLRGAVFYDPDGKLDGYILFYEGEVKDGTGGVAGKRLFSFLVGDEVVPVPSSIIWDLAEAPDVREQGEDITSLRKQALPFVIEGLRKYRDELARARGREAEIKEKYGVKSLEYLIVKLDGELISLYQRREQGENVELAIHNKEARKSEYERALEELRERTVKERSLTMSMPKFVGALRVKPAPAEEGVEGMRQDEEIERIGMEVALEYERRRGREPVDVSSENLGFDIRSTDKEGRVRYIEVKARAGTGAVELTQNEWFKAHRFGDDYYLYAVMNAASTPRLYVVQNPAENLRVKEKVVRWMADFEEIEEKGGIQ